MDVSSVSSASQPAQIQETASILVMRKALDIQAAQGAQLVQMMDQSVGLGRNINTTA